MATNALTRLTTNPATDWRAVFSPDGQSVAFASDRAGASAVFRIAADGSGQETEVYRNPAGGAFPSDWSRDGRQLLVQLEDRLDAAAVSCRCRWTAERRRRSSRTTHQISPAGN